MIETMAKIMMMFGVIIVGGLFLVWVNDTLEAVLKRPKKLSNKGQFSEYPLRRLMSPVSKPNYRITVYQIPSFVQDTALTASVQPDLTDFAKKIVHIDFNEINRSPEQGNQLGDHVRVFSKAA